jgi:hypothetical protein
MLEFVPQWISKCYPAGLVQSYETCWVSCVDRKIYSDENIMVLIFPEYIVSL